MQKENKKEKELDLSNVYVTYSPKYFMVIATKLKHAPGLPMKGAHMVKYLAANVPVGRSLAIVAIPEGKKPDDADPRDIVGCCVLSYINTSEGDMLWIDYVWSADRKTTLKMQKFVEDLAKEKGVEYIAGNMRRGFKAAEKYGFKEDYRVFKKTLNLEEV